MRKTNHQTQFKTQKFRHDDLTPKIMAKSPLAYRQRNLVGKSSAAPTNKIQSKETSIFKSRNTRLQFQNSITDKKTFSDEQIRNSSVYKKLEEEILSLIRRQESEFQKLDELKSIKQRQIQQIKEEQRSIKLQIWQLRNENMELKEAIEIQNDENLRMMNDLGITEEDFQMHLKSEEEEQNSQNPQINPHENLSQNND